MSAKSMGVAQMEVAARDYCRLIEQADGSVAEWLAQVAVQLPRLHAAVTSLDSGDGEAPAPRRTDLDRRFELFSQLRELLGYRDGYWMEYDDPTSRQEMTGSLADDLTDIYFDVKQGLEWLDSRRPEQAAGVWRSGYRLHWGEHLVDAERQLYHMVRREPRALYRR